MLLLFFLFLWQCSKTVTYKGYNSLVASLLSERVKFRARLCLWSVRSACNALVNLADRLNVAYIPQWQRHQNNLRRHTCVLAAPAPAVTVYGDGRFLFWCIYWVALSLSEVALISVLKFYKPQWGRQVRKIRLDSGERYWTGDWHYWTVGLPLSAPSSFLVFRWWQIWRDDTIQTSRVFQCRCDLAALGYFSNLFQVSVSVGASQHSVHFPAVAHTEQWPSH